MIIIADTLKEKDDDVRDIIKEIRLQYDQYHKVPHSSRDGTPSAATTPEKRLTAKKKKKPLITSLNKQRAKMRPEKPNVENGVFFFPPPTLFLAHVHSRREGNEVERWSPLCVGRKGVGVLLFYFFFPIFRFFFRSSAATTLWGATVCLLLSLPFNEHLHIKLNDYSSFFVFFQQALTFRVKKKGGEKKKKRERQQKKKKKKKP